MVTSHGIRLRLLLAVAVVSGALSWIGLRLWTGAGNLLPAVSWAALPILLAVAVGLYLAGRPVKRLVEGTATRTVHPLYAARVLALAQAAALTGALVAGWYAAQVVLVLPDADVGSQQQVILQLVVLGLGALLVSASGLLVQRMCRIDPPDDRGGADDGDDEPEHGHSHDHHRER